jgi:hypothetical protein
MDAGYLVEVEGRRKDGSKVPLEVALSVMVSKFARDALAKGQRKLR